MLWLGRLLLGADYKCGSWEDLIMTVEPTHSAPASSWFLLCTLRFPISYSVGTAGYSKLSECSRLFLSYTQCPDHLLSPRSTLQRAPTYSGYSHFLFCPILGYLALALNSLPTLLSQSLG